MLMFAICMPAVVLLFVEYVYLFMFLIDEVEIHLSVLHLQARNIMVLYVYSTRPVAIATGLVLFDGRDELTSPWRGGAR